MEKQDTINDMDKLVAHGARSCYTSIMAHLDGITPELRKKLMSLYRESLELQTDIYNNSKQQ